MRQITFLKQNINYQNETQEDVENLNRLITMDEVKYTVNNEMVNVIITSNKSCWYSGPLIPCNEKGFSLLWHSSLKPIMAV